jgi:transposase InsO family protein
MGFHVQAESYKVERPAVYMMEFWEEHTLEFYDQPPSIKLAYKDKKGRNRGHWYTPDYFVIRTNEIGWEEWKTEDELKRRSEENPNLFVFGEDKQWHCPPADRYAADLGLVFRVRSSNEINYILYRNLRFLRSYYHPDCPPSNVIAAEAITATVAKEPGIRLDILLKRKETREADEVYKLIASGQIYANLGGYPLAEPDRVQLFESREIAQSYLYVSHASIIPRDASAKRMSLDVNQTVDWDGKPWQVINIGDTQTSLLRIGDGMKDNNERLVVLSNSMVQQLVQSNQIKVLVEPGQTGLAPEANRIWLGASKEDLREANRRFEIIAPLITGQGTGQATERKVSVEGTSSRTIRKWILNFRQAEQKYGWGYIGLLNAYKKSGNRTQKMADSTQEAIEYFITTQYETVKGKSKKQVYAEFRQSCIERGITPVSYATFLNKIRTRSGYKQTKAREGSRAAYPLEQMRWELTMTTPRHGDRPWECVHIDHAKLPILICSSTTGKVLGRPWLTLATDANSRRVCASYVTFDPPSYRSDMMVLRDTVRRFNRLPETIIVDQGSDFESVYFDSILAYYWCDKLTRPGSKPRYGSIIERLFGVTKRQFVYNLRGNTWLLRNIRRVSMDVNPKRFAVWTLDRFCARLEQFLFEYYDNKQHPSLGQSPREAYMQGMAQGGWRRHQHIAYNEDFLIVTLPSTSKGTAKVQPNRGVKINYHWYWAEELRDPEVENTQVAVRYDPFDVSFAYAYVRGAWVRCISKYAAILAGRTERQIMILTSELRKQNQNYARRYITDTSIVALIRSAEGEELLLAQEMRDHELKQAVTSLTGKRIEDTMGILTGEESPSIRSKGTLDFEPASGGSSNLSLPSSPKHMETRAAQEVDELVKEYSEYYDAD